MMRFALFLLLGLSTQAMAQTAQVQLNIRLLPVLESGPVTAECHYDSQTHSAHLNVKISTFQTSSSQIHLRWTGINSPVFYRPIARLNGVAEPWRPLPAQKDVFLESTQRGEQTISFEVRVENAAPDSCQTPDFGLLLTQSPS